MIQNITANCYCKDFFGVSFSRSCVTHDTCASSIIWAINKQAKQAKQSRIPIIDVTVLFFHFTDGNDVRLHYERRGDVPTLIITHLYGNGSSGTQFPITAAEAKRFLIALADANDADYPNTEMMVDCIWASY